MHKDKPKDRKATYMREVRDIRPHEKETHSIRLTAVGNLIDYPGDVSTPTSDLTTMKLHVDSAISYVKRIYICMDAKYFYLQNIMDREEYITIQIAIIPQEFVDKYNLQGKAQNEIREYMDLPQSRRIAHDTIVNHLDLYGYHPSSKTSGLWTHKNQPIKFTLVVNDFGVKYLGKSMPYK